MLKTKNDQNCQKIKLWKSDNQGVKEETFIQTGRRGRDRQLGQREHAARWWLEDGAREGMRQQLVEWAVPHFHVDILEGTTG